MSSLPTRLRVQLFALAALPNLLPAADLLNGMPVEILSRSTVMEAGGRKITFVRIRPPAASPRPAPVAAPAAESTAAALAEAERLEAKLWVMWLPSVTVHTRPPIFTELRFRVGGRDVTVWTNVDFRVLLSVHRWEGETAVYNWLPGFGEVEGADDVRPADLDLTPGPAEYVVEATDAELAAHEDAFAPLDSILAYHDLNHDALLIAQARRLALEAEQKAELARLAALPPSKPKDQTIYFWKNERPAPR